MAVSAQSNRYSRFVSWAKIILPLLALALLSVMFLISRTAGITNSIPYADIDASGVGRDQRISDPNYAGVTRDGTAISITATMARPSVEGSDEISASDLRAELEIEGAGFYKLSSLNGIIDTKKGYAVLDGGIEILSPSGYRITTEKMNIALKHTELETDGPVKATGPEGMLEAGKMVLTHAKDGAKENEYLLIFKNGVRLVYTPASE